MWLVTEVRDDFWRPEAVIAMWEGDHYSGTKSEKKSISRLVETKILNTAVHCANSCKANFGDWLKHTTEKQNQFLATKREKNGS